MSRAVALVAGVVLGIASSCAPPEVCGPLPLPPSSSLSSSFGVVAHAHNDYEHERPLHDALDHGFASVEADVWLRADDIVVSHDPWSSRGTLSSLYLEPLAARVQERGTVHGDGAPFFLWLDLKDGTSGLRERLVAALRAQPFLHPFGDDEGLADVDVARGSVVVIVTGDAGSKRALLDEVPAPRPFLIDDNSLPDPATGGQGSRDAMEGATDDDAIDPRVGAFAVSFPTWVGAWDGVTAPSSLLRQRASCIVVRAHGEGSRRRAVRFFGGPDTELAWDFAVDVGADFLHTDDLAGVAAFLAERRERSGL